MRGNRAFDAQLAAVCVEHGVRDIVTLDRDMSRMPSIRSIPPERIFV
jgi:predicted nucleic acid-binding protein